MKDYMGKKEYEDIKRKALLGESDGPTAIVLIEDTPVKERFSYLYHDGNETLINEIDRNSYSEKLKTNDMDFVEYYVICDKFDEKEKLSELEIEKLILENINLQFVLANLISKGSYQHYEFIEFEREILEKVFKEISLKKYLINNKEFIFLNLSMPADNVIKVFKKLYLDKKINKYISYYFLDKKDNRENKSFNTKTKYYSFIKNNNAKKFGQINDKDEFILYLDKVLNSIGYISLMINRNVKELKDNSFIDYMVSKYNVLLVEYESDGMECSNESVITFMKK